MWKTKCGCMTPPIIDWFLFFNRETGQQQEEEQQGPVNQQQPPEPEQGPSHSAAGHTRPLLAKGKGKGKKGKRSASEMVRKCNILTVS
jgi:hypothetical protein